MSRIPRILQAVLPPALALIMAMPRGAMADGAPPSGAQATLVDAMRKQPYLIYPGTPGRMQVLWQLSAQATSTIEWGTDAAYGAGSTASEEYGADHQHAVTIDGLAPATKYLYRVTTDGFAYTGSFTSAPAPEAQQLEFLAYGDTRTYPAAHDLLAAGMLSVIAADPAYQTMALFMGDFVGSGNSEAAWTNEFFSPAYPSIRALLARVPLQSCMGNHENSSPVLFTKYYPYPWVAGRYWSFDYGPVHVTVIDQYSAWTAGSAQLAWVAADLAASRKTWKFVLLHEPGWSTGNGHANNADVQALIQPLCEQYGVSIVFAGHNHNYGRAVVNGVVHLTTGGGGAPLEQPLALQPYVVTTAMKNHFCRLAIDGGVLHLRAIESTSGAVLDSFTLVRAVAGVEGGGPAGNRALSLARPQPNPAQGGALLRFSLPAAGHARMEIVDLGGRRTWSADSQLTAGPHEWRWNGENARGERAASGLYFVRLVTPWGTRSERLTLLQ